jgi:hypothetical protein
VTQRGQLVLERLHLRLRRVFEPCDGLRAGTALALDGRLHLTDAPLQLQQLLLDAAAADLDTDRRSPSPRS